MSATGGQHVKVMATSGPRSENSCRTFVIRVSVMFEGPPALIGRLDAATRGAAMSATNWRSMNEQELTELFPKL